MNRKYCDTELTYVLDLLALLTLLPEFEAAGGVAANLPAGHFVVPERLGYDDIFAHVAVCPKATGCTS